MTNHNILWLTKENYDMIFFKNYLEKEIKMLFEKIKLIDENFKLCEDMYLQTEGERISYIGKTKPKDYKGDMISGKNKVLMSGFYNTHCHVPMTFLRGYGEGLPLQEWLFDKIFPYEACLTGEDIYYGSLLGIMELLSSGAVSFSDMYFQILKVAWAAEESGIKANICHGISSFDENVDLKSLQGYKDTMELMNLCKNGTGRIKADMGLHAEYTSTENLVRQVAEAALSDRLIVHTHISETKKEHEECKKKHGGLTPVQYFKQCGLFQNPVKAAHCVVIEEEDVEILKEASATISHCISSNLKLGSGVLPMAKYKEKGLNIVIATDGASSNNNLNLMEEIHLASMVAKGITQEPTVCDAKTMLRMASLNGAKAQGREDCGSLKVGNKADMIMFDLDKPHLQPDFDTMANIVYSAQASDICMTMVDGRILYRNGEFLTIDKEKVMFEIRKRHQRILGEL